MLSPVVTHFALCIKEFNCVVQTWWISGFFMSTDRPDIIIILLVPLSFCSGCVQGLPGPKNQEGILSGPNVEEKLKPFTDFLTICC